MIGYVSSLFCLAKEGEYQRSTPTPELPIGRAASIRTSPLSRKPERHRVLHQFLACRLYDQAGVKDNFRVADHPGLTYSVWRILHAKWRVLHSETIGERLN